MRSDIVTVSTRSGLMERDIGSEQAERRRKDTERGGIERKRRDATSPLAAVAGGGMTARRATATGGTNTRRARGARRAKRPVRISEQTKRTRRAWSSDHRLLLVLLLCPSPTTNKKQKGEDETKKTRKSQ